MSTFELSLDSITFECSGESALHQYYMPTLAEEKFFLLANVNRREHKHNSRKQKFKLLPYVGKLTEGMSFLRKGRKSMKIEQFRGLDPAIVQR